MTRPPGGPRFVGWIVPGVELISEQPQQPASEAAPPTAVELEVEGLIAPDFDPYQYFDHRARQTAAWLTAHGVQGLHSVTERIDGPTPDAVFVRPGAIALDTLEMKSLDEPTETAISQGIRRGRRQSRIVVIDGRAAGATRQVAERALRRAVRSYGNDLDQVVVVLNYGPAIGWMP